MGPSWRYQETRARSLIARTVEIGIACGSGKTTSRWASSSADAQGCSSPVAPIFDQHGYAEPACLSGSDMKMITLPKLRDSLRDATHEVKVPADTAGRARVPIERMVAIG
jgi:hypothetical protein